MRRIRKSEKLLDFIDPAPWSEWGCVGQLFSYLVMASFIQPVN
jgi:hypothetical protein